VTSNSRTAMLRALTLSLISALTIVTWASIDPADSGALWVAGSKGLYNVRAETASVDSAALLGEGVQDVTVSLVDATAWAYGDKTLFRVDPDDGSVAAFALPSSVGGGDPSGLVADGANRLVWVAIGDSLYRLDTATGVVETASFGPAVTGLALDHRSGDLWVALADEVRRAS